MDMNISYSIVGSSVDPSIFGPAMWFTFHNGAVQYPNRPTEFIKHGMKQFLLNVPIMIPCISCREHFYTLLSHTDLDQVVSSREALFKFWVDAHNYVNKRYGKPVISLRDAKDLYGFNDPSTGSFIRIKYNAMK